jgi:aspartyl-tRNA(Asn)/glutamyl-tRNA(Gln) amidotransferase subunit A
MIAFASSLDQCGPFTHTVADAALMTKIMAGPDPHDGTTAKTEPEIDLDDVEPPVANLRIGVAKQYVVEGANEPGVQRATDDAIDFYKQQGAEILEVDLPHTKYGIPVYYVVATAECSSNLARYDGVHFGHRTAEPVGDIVELFSRSRAEGFGDEVKRRVMLGTYALSAGYADQYYHRALCVRRLIKQDFDRAFEDCDVILCPTTTGPAFRFGEKKDDPLAMYLNDIYTVNANLAGIAGISLPAGTTEVQGQSLPVGIQLIGNAFEERKLLRIARMYEREHAFHAERPVL